MIEFSLSKVDVRCPSRSLINSLGYTVGLKGKGDRRNASRRWVRSGGVDFCVKRWLTGKVGEGKGLRLPIVEWWWFVIEVHLGDGGSSYNGG